MDEKPFLSFDITTIKEQHIKELAKFHKSGFDIDSILTTASELKYSNAIKIFLTSEFLNPTPEFVRFIASHIYEGRLTEKVMIQFTDIVKKTVEQTFNDIVSDRLMNAINQTKPAVQEPAPENQPLEIEENKIVTTDEEINGLYIVKSILRSKVAVTRVHYKDSTNYFSVILDDNIRKPLCRLWLNGKSKKFIGLFDKEKKETKYEIGNLDDIFNHSEQLIGTVDYYDK
jgi:hypothetical protein